jgi:hypothetical protein
MNELLRPFVLCFSCGKRLEVDRRLILNRLQVPHAHA